MQIVKLWKMKTAQNISEMKRNLKSHFSINTKGKKNRITNYEDNTITVSGDTDETEMEAARLSPQQQFDKYDVDNYVTEEIPSTSAIASVESQLSPKNLPYLLDGELFEVNTLKNGTCTAICKNCPGKKTIKGTLQSTGNFISHIKRVHPSFIKRMEEKRTRKKKGSHCSTSGRTKYGIVKPHINPFFSRESTFCGDQNEAREHFPDYVINEMLPLATDVKPTFQNHVSPLTPVPSTSAIGSDVLPGSPKNLPYLLDGELFEVNTLKNGTCTAICKNCPGKKTIKGTLQSTGNFISHIKRVHPSLIKRIEEKRTHRKERSHTSASERVKFGNLNPPLNQIFRKQSKLYVTQKEVLEAISNYVINEMLPLATVENPTFQNLVSTLTKGNLLPIQVPDITDFGDSLERRYQIMLHKLKETLDSQEYVCTTVDIWSQANKRFLGMTCHYIDSASLERKSLALVCQRMESQHTYDKIAEAVHAVHEAYGIMGKVTHTVTGNVTNFGKGFCYNMASKNVCICDTEQEGSNTDGPDVDIAEINLLTDPLSCICEDVSLPPCILSCSHSLQLIATIDVDASCFGKMAEAAGYKKLHQVSFRKLSVLWNLLSCSQQASDICERLWKRLPVPNHNRWIAYYEAIKSLLLEKDHLDSLFNALKIPKPETVELEFLEEYVQLMRPLADALDILQGEHHCYLGTVLPLLLSIQKRIEGCQNLTHCGPLQQIVLASLKKRFQNILDFSFEESHAFVLASVSHPRFKMTWVLEEYIDETKALFISTCEQVQRLATSANEPNNTSVLADYDFFSVLNTNSFSEDHRSFKTASLEALHFLDNMDNNLSSLQKYPAVKAVFMKYNTSLPSSAPVERFFGVGGQLLTPRINKLKDIHFEMLLLLRSNSILLM